MKKVIIAILAIFYLGTSTGATVHFHFCMDKLISWEFGQNGKGTCGGCGMNKSKGHQKHKCCTDDFKVFKTSVQANTGSFLYTLDGSNVGLPTHNLLQPVVTSSCSMATPFSIKGFRSPENIQTLYCIFRI